MFELRTDRPDYDEHEAEQARRHRHLERLAREEEMEDALIDEKMYEKWEKERW